MPNARDSRSRLSCNCYLKSEQAFNQAFCPENSQRKPLVLLE